MDDFGDRFAAQRIIGKRNYQEDDYGVWDGRAEPGLDGDEHTLLLVADGMGGHVGGDTASRLVRETFIETYRQISGLVTDRLRACLDAANQAIVAAIKERPELDGMGSTLVAAVVSKQGLEWLSIGDSPSWLFRNGHLERINADHSMAPVLADLVATGRMTAEEAAKDAKRHMLRSAVTGDEITLVDVSSQPRNLKKDDLLLLASDGIMTLDEQEIANILQDMHDASPKEKSAALVKAIEDADRPNQDNATILLYRPGTDCGMEPIVADGDKLQATQVGTPVQKAKFPLMAWASIIIGVIVLGLLASFLVFALPA